MMITTAKSRMEMEPMNEKERDVAVKVLIETPWHSFSPGHTRAEGLLQPGDVVRLPAGMASEWIRSGRAEYVNE